MAKASTKASKRRAKKGRPKASGLREPNGRLSRSGIAHSPAYDGPFAVRARQLGITAEQAMDQKAGTFIGYLNLLGPVDGLSNAQYEGAVSYLEFRNRLSRVLKTPGALYDPEAVGAGGEITEEYEKWCRDTMAEDSAIKKAVQAEQNYSRENLWAAIQYVIMGDQHLHHMIGATRLACNVFARHFKTMNADRHAA